MPLDTDRCVELDFGDAEALDASLSDCVRGLTGSEILKIAADIRELVRGGATVCNLTVGDFDSRYFAIPDGLRRRLHEAIDAGETNYPPSDGVLALRQAVVEHAFRCHGVRYPLESVLIASGARPLLYGAYRCVLNPGDRVVYPVPSWNNNHYAWISGAVAVEVPTEPEDGFMPTLESLMPHLGTARMLCLNTPLNPTGTVMDPGQLGELTRAIVSENERRAQQGRQSLFLLLDQVYGGLTFGGSRHIHPVQLVPEAAPWVITLDAVSKILAATGLRVGWLLAPPAVTARFRDLIGHVGAWAPRPEQVAVAGFLEATGEMEEFAAQMQRRVSERLEALAAGIHQLRNDGYAVDCIQPQGAIYLSMRLDLIGRSADGRRLETNEDLRRLLLKQAGIAVVPFQAFGLREESGWFRLSVGAISLEEIDAAFPRLRRLLDTID